MRARLTRIRSHGNEKRCDGLSPECTRPSHKNLTLWYWYNISTNFGTGITVYLWTNLIDKSQDLIVICIKKRKIYFTIYIISLDFLFEDNNFPHIYPQTVVFFVVE